MKSRISNVVNHKYCELDGTECIKCRKCHYMPKPSRNLLSKLLIVILIALLIYIMFFQTLPMAVKLYQLQGGITIG